jgi:hypothetical protein
MPGNEVNTNLFSNSANDSDNIGSANNTDNTILYNALELVNIFSNIPAECDETGEVQDPFSKSDPLPTPTRNGSAKWSKTDRIGSGRYSTSASSVPVMQLTSRSMNRRQTDIVTETLTTNEKEGAMNK